MKKIVVVGSINMDLVIQSNRQPKIGETIMGSDFFTSPGGKGANQAVAVAKLGGKVTMIGCIGNDSFGHDMINNMQNLGIETKYIKICKDIPTGVAMINIVNGDNSIIINSGANYSLLKSDILYLEDIISQHEIMLIGHEVSDEVIESSVKIAKTHNLTVILNPAPARSINPWVLENVDFLTPNLSETEVITKTKINNTDDIKKSIRILKEMGVKNVVMTLGKDGAAYSLGDFVVFKQAPSVAVVDTTAAGDTFNGAFAVKLAQGLIIEDAVSFGIFAASLTVTKKGAQNSIPTLKEVLEI